MRLLRFPDLDLDALEVGGDLQWQEPSDDSHSAAERGLIWVDGGVVDWCGWWEKMIFSGDHFVSGNPKGFG